MRRTTFKTILSAFLSSSVLAATSIALFAEETKVAVAPAGKLERLTVEFGLPSTDAFALVGRDARQQLVVTGHEANGRQSDLTRQVAYAAEPAGIVTIDSQGLVLPAAEGRAVIAIRHADAAPLSVAVEVKNLIKDTPVNFGEEVVPVFTKFSCNSGGCHGKASGQNGFRLSLLGFEPQEDYEHLVKEGRGRRLFPSAPDRSLLLLKAVGAMPHGGGAQDRSRQSRLSRVASLDRTRHAARSGRRPQGRPHRGDADAADDDAGERATTGLRRALHRRLDARRDQHGAIRPQRYRDGFVYAAGSR
ncbi:MAG: hypothetical protein QM811_28945 [Pirellulales bacterium]